MAFVQVQLGPRGMTMQLVFPEISRPRNLPSDPSEQNFALVVAREPVNPQLSVQVLTMSSSSESSENSESTAFSIQRWSNWPRNGNRKLMKQQPAGDAPNEKFLRPKTSLPKSKTQRFWTTPPSAPLFSSPWLQLQACSYTHSEDSGFLSLRFVFLSWIQSNRHLVAQMSVTRISRPWRVPGALLPRVSSQFLWIWQNSYHRVSLMRGVGGAKGFSRSENENVKIQKWKPSGWS